MGIGVIGGLLSPNIRCFKENLDRDGSLRRVRGQLCLK